jgi:hypothetical protein
MGKVSLSPLSELTTSCSWLLLRHLAQKAPTLDAEPTTVDEVDMAAVEDASEETPDSIPTLEDLHMPRVSYDDARRIMTRADFVEQLDHLHVRPLLPPWIKLIYRSSP